MNLYTIGYHGWEEAPYTVLANDKELTNEELEAIVIEASKKVSDKTYRQFFSSYYRKLIAVLLDDYDFKEVEYKAQFYTDEFSKLKDGKFVTESK